MKKWQKVQQTSEYFVDGIALVLATLITYLVFGKGLHRILLYTADEWKSYCFMLFVAYSAIRSPKRRKRVAKTPHLARCQSKP